MMVDERTYQPGACQVGGGDLFIALGPPFGGLRSKWKPFKSSLGIPGD